ncbi:MAG: histidine phosphatase family protein [Rhodospirillales bacterium]|nr:histidine phosphatase family protein [Rhodospirillales bacterium]MCB9996941.1 histidine phosphatase family protein [Rhodospirillales bacterium]
MSKTLYILRHEKAAASADGQDQSRPLSPEGRQDAQALGAWLEARNFSPDIILCSPARRTRETCAALCEESAAQYPDHLYLASAGMLYDTIKQQDDDKTSLLLVAHNPGIHELVRFLTGSGAPETLRRIQGGYQPGWMTVLEVDADVWEDILPGACALKDLRSGSLIREQGI